MNKKIRSVLVTLMAVGLLCVALPVMANAAIIPADTDGDMPVARSAAPATTPEYDGIIAVAGREEAFTVVSVTNDAKSHVIVLADKAGKQGTLKFGPAVKNFNQLKAGDYVVVSENAQIVVFYDKVGQVPGFGESIMVFTAPKGLKPGLIVMEKAFVTLQITAVDANKKTVTITLPDNTSKTITAPKVDYSKIKTGHDIILLQEREKSIMVVPPTAK